MYIACGETCHVAGDDKGSQSLVTCVRIGPSDNKEMMCLRRQTDPHLLTIENVNVSAPFCGSLHRYHVAACARLGQAERAIFLAACLWGKKFLLLLLGSPLQHSHAVEAHMHRHHNTQTCIDSLQFFANQTQCDVIKALTTIP